MGGEGVIFLEFEAMGRGSSPPRTASWWDGKPGRMPPRMGAWQPERLRYGAATKNQRVAERFPERKARSKWGEGAGFPPSPGWRAERAEIAEGKRFRAALGCTRRSLMPLRVSGRTVPWVRPGSRRSCLSVPG